MSWQGILEVRRAGVKECGVTTLLRQGRASRQLLSEAKRIGGARLGAPRLYR